MIAALPAAPVANSIRVSEVEVSPSTVTQLKLVAVPAVSSACSTACGRAASVKTKLSIVAMSGAIMPAPLAMPLIVTVTPSMAAWRVASFGKVSVVMIAWAAAAQASAPSSVRPGAIGEHALELGGVEGLADHAGRGDEDLFRPALRPPRRRSGGQRHGLAPAQAREGIGVAGIHHEGSGARAAQRLAAPIHRARRGISSG